MCGIVGYIGKRNATRVLVDGLKFLEYRGYDSSGIAYVLNNSVHIIKSEGKISNLESKIDENINSNIGIGHTRWATHGEPNSVNAHPHKCGGVTLVHNGIIENYVDLKERLSLDYNFVSETDTEVLCALIDSLYKKYKDKFVCFEEMKKLVIGSYALAIIFDDESDTIYALRKDSPLILASSNDEYFAASDVAAILKYTNKYYLLDTDEVAVIKSTGIKILKDGSEVSKEINVYDGTFADVMKNGYEHFMLKEINDEPIVFENIINTYVPDYNIETLEKSFGDFKKYRSLSIVGCGSAYHAGLVSRELIEKYANIRVDVHIASEYRYKKIFTGSDDLTILVSQSGETADTLEALKKAHDNGSDTLGIINVVSSSIARLSDKVIYIKAGSEIAVATTKAYQAQILILSLLGILIGYQRGEIDYESANSYLADLKKIPDMVRKLIEDSDNYKKIAQKIYNQKDMFFIGRGIDYSICCEGSLKVKEISYIHSEAYAAGELKHGTISLIEPGTVVVGIVTSNDLYLKTISNLKETVARGSEVLFVTNEEIFNRCKNDSFYNHYIVVPNLCEFFQNILIMVPLQLVAYYVAYYKGEAIDKPRNLAKSVTVE